MDQSQFMNELAQAHGSISTKVNRLIEMFQTLEEDSKKSRDPVLYDLTVTTTNQPVVVMYKERKHIFVYNNSASSITLTSTDGYVLPLPPQVWSIVGFREGTRLTSSGAAMLSFKCTDEVQP